MTTPLNEREQTGDAGLFAGAPPMGDAGLFAGEPPMGDAVDRIFGTAERLRRRRARLVVAAGLLVVAVVVVAGYALTTLLLPAAARRTPAPAAPPRPDRIRELLTAAVRPSGLTVVPREPARGEGWRQYLVLATNGRPHGLIEVSAYRAPGGLCFPVLADRSACARPMTAATNVHYVRYAVDHDPDWQVVEVIARHLTDGRTVVVQATGERGTGSRTAGQAPLTPLLAARLATDPVLAAAFDPQESCNDNPACPVLRVPVRPAN